MFATILRRLGFALMLLSMTAGAAIARSTTDFTGYWVVGVGERNLIVLNLKPGEGLAPIGGSLSRPVHFDLTGDLVSHVEMPVASFPIVQSSIEGDRLRFTVENPNDKSDRDTFDLLLSSPDQAELKLADTPMIPWPVEKAVGPVSVATDWDKSQSYSLAEEETTVSNPEMSRLFQADQADRQAGLGKIDWAVVGKADARRREATRALIAKGALHTGEDFEHAAFVFQHGGTAQDYLLAHTLAMIAVAKGDKGAIWIASATLDRYLQQIGQSQIYGTQYTVRDKGEPTQEPYDRGLISDALRRQLGVPPLATQEEQRKLFKAGAK